MFTCFRTRLVGRVLGLSLACWTAWSQLPGQGPVNQIPHVRGTTLAGGPVQLPEDLHGKVGVLVVGFSEASRGMTTDWGRRLAVDYLQSTTVMYYEMPVLAGVPRILRGFVVGKIKSSIVERARDKFLPVLDHEAEWKAAVGYAKQDDAYVLVVDGAGSVKWRAEGAVTDSSYAEVKRRVEELRIAK